MLSGLSAELTTTSAFELQQVTTGHSQAFSSYATASGEFSALEYGSMIAG
jgi:hypothetical protein